MPGTERLGEELLRDSGLVGRVSPRLERRGAKNRSRSPSPRPPVASRTLPAVGREGSKEPRASKVVGNGESPPAPGSQSAETILPSTAKAPVGAAGKSGATARPSRSDNPAPQRSESARTSQTGGHLAQTKIPEKYHVIEKAPVVHEDTSDGWDYVPQDRSWVRTRFPSRKAGGRAQVAELAKTFDLMLEESQGGGLQAEQAVYDAVLHEITRQVHAECADRGLLLDRVVERYHSLFERVPQIITDLDRKVEELESGNRKLLVLLEKAMHAQSEAEQKLAQGEAQFVKEMYDANATIVNHKEELQTLQEQYANARSRVLLLEEASMNQNIPAESLISADLTSQKSTTGGSHNG